MAEALDLSFGFQFADLYSCDALTRVDCCFLDKLKDWDGELRSRLVEARSAPEKLDGKMHDITVKLSKSDLKARARKRYLASK